LQYVAVCCSVLRCVHMYTYIYMYIFISGLDNLPHCSIKVVVTYNVVICNKN